MPLENGLSQEEHCTIRKRWSAKSVTFFLEPFQECVTGWGRWAMEQRVLGTSHQVIKCPSIPFQNLMKTSIFIKSRVWGPQQWDSLKLLQKAGGTMTKIQARKQEVVNARTWWCLFFQQGLNSPIAIAIFTKYELSVVSELACPKSRASFPNLTLSDVTWELVTDQGGSIYTMETSRCHQ